MFDRYQHTCSICNLEDERSLAFKKAWGCVEDTEYKQDSIPCFTCGGEDTNCSICHGSNIHNVYHCPRKFVKETHFEIVRTAARAKNFKIWPIVGGSLDQSRSFIQAFDLIVNEISNIEQEELKKNASKQKSGS